MPNLFSKLIFCTKIELHANLKKIIIKTLHVLLEEENSSEIILRAKYIHQISLNWKCCIYRRIFTCMLSIVELGKFGMEAFIRLNNNPHSF